MDQEGNACDKFARHEFKLQFVNQVSSRLNSVIKIDSV